MTPVDIAPLVDAVRDLGFPAAVAFFVLWRLDTSLHDVIREIQALRAEVEHQRALRPPTG